MSMNDHRRAEAEAEPPASPASDVLTYQQAAQLLGAPVGTLYSWVHHRRIPHVRLGRRLVRFRRSELLGWLADHEVSPES